MNMLRGAPNVVQLLEIFYSKDVSGRLIQNLVMEFCGGGSLEDYLVEASNANVSIPMEVIKLITRQLFTGLSHMHALNIAHRDLKPENVLIKQLDCDQGIEVKVGDLGAAKVLSNTGQNTPYVVSRYYRAPELVMGTKKYDCSIDIWATGCILFELVTRTPFCPSDSEGLSILEHV